VVRLDTGTVAHSLSSGVCDASASRLEETLLTVHAKPQQIGAGVMSE